MPLNSGISVPGLTCRNRSAASAVALRRGSTTISLAPGLLHPVLHAQEQDRMAVRHVRAGDEEQVREIEILIRAGRPVGAERQLVARRGAGHAIARVRLDVVGADEPLRQLVGEVLRLHRHLAGDVERDRIRPVRVYERAQAPPGLGDRLLHRHGKLVGLAVLAQRRVLHAPGADDRLRGRRALGAETAEVRRVIFVARQLLHLAAVHLQDHAAADAAIGADRLDRLHLRAHASSIDAALNTRRPGNGRPFSSRR